MIFCSLEYVLLHLKLAVSQCVLYLTSEINMSIN